MTTDKKDIIEAAVQMIDILNVFLDIVETDGKELAGKYAKLTRLYFDSMEDEGFSREETMQIYRLLFSQIGKK